MSNRGIRQGADMKKLTGILILLVALGVTGCGNPVDRSPEEKIETVQNESIAESLANEEYDSIEDFLADNNETIFVMNFQKMSKSATPPNATGFTVIDNHVSMAKSYIAVIYECETDGHTFQIELVTYRSDSGEEQLGSIISSNPGIFTEKEIGEILTYYCPGSQYDWFDCYAMVINGKMIVIDIEKGYDKYMETVLDSIQAIQL